MATLGGKRPGAGRKKGQVSKKTAAKRIEEAEARAHIVAAYTKHWKKIEKATLALALGKIKSVEYHGKIVRVYERPPSEKMLQMIIETVIGKAKQPIDGSINMPELQALSADIRTILSKNSKAK